MTRREFYKKVCPEIRRVLDHYRDNGVKAVADSFLISCLKEMDYRLNINADDEVDDIPEFDDMDPEFFVNTFLQLVEDWDDAARILCCGDEGFETYTEFIKMICHNWKERKNASNRK